MENYKKFSIFYTFSSVYFLIRNYKFLYYTERLILSPCSRDAWSLRLFALIGLLRRLEWRQGARRNNHRLKTGRPPVSRNPSWQRSLRFWKPQTHLQRRTSNTSSSHSPDSHPSPTRVDMAGNAAEHIAFIYTHFNFFCW